MPLRASFQAAERFSQPALNSMTFSDLIKAERARLNLTQAEAATLLDVPARTLWEWEHAKTEPLPVAQEGVIARLKRAKKRG